MKDLIFTVSLDEANLILEGLGHLPFARVYGLVAKVQQQASEQVKGISQSGAPSASELSGVHAGGIDNGSSNGQ